jgi:hypothetical protein
MARCFSLVLALLCALDCAALPPRPAFGLKALTAEQSCVAVPGANGADDEWCTTSCNAVPANCPSTLCSCKEGAQAVRNDLGRLKQVNGSADVDGSAAPSKDDDKPRFTAATAQIVQFLEERFGTIFTAQVSTTMAEKLVAAMAKQGIRSLAAASKAFGHGDISNAKELCGLAGIKMDASLLKEFLSSDEEAAAEKISPEQAAKSKAKEEAEVSELSDFLKKQLGSIVAPAASETMASKVVDAMIAKNIKSLTTASRILGAGALAKAQEVCANAGVTDDLEPMLLKEWFQGVNA